MNGLTKLIMGVKKWVNRQIAAISLATASVEKDILNQTSVELEGSVGNFQRHNQGCLMDALTKGEITQEVIDLRWRTFKVLHESNDIIAEKIDDTYKGFKTNKKALLDNIKLDTYDDYPLEMVVNNDDVTIGSHEAMFNETMVASETENEKKLIDKDVISTTIGNISNDDYHSSIKKIKPLIVNRELRPKFEIEKYTKKLNVRKVNETQRLLEFYVSIYPDVYDRKSRLFLAEIEKTINNPRSTTILDIKDVGFVSYKTLGVNDFYRFEYKITEFDKIITYDGNYVIKFKSDVTINGEYLLEKYRSTELDKRYENKEAKK